MRISLRSSRHTVETVEFCITWIASGEELTARFARIDDRIAELAAFHPARIYLQLLDPTDLEQLDLLVEATGVRAEVAA
jgi:hypothetical protein